MRLGVGAAMIASVAAPCGCSFRPAATAVCGHGWSIAQEGRVLYPFNPKVKLAFSERVEGFGVYDESNGWRSPYENYIYDDEERWVHLRRERTE